MSETAENTMIVPWEEVQAGPRMAQPGVAYPAKSQKITRHLSQKSMPNSPTLHHRAKGAKLQLLRRKIGRLALQTPPEPVEQQQDTFKSKTPFRQSHLPDLQYGTLWDVFSNPPSPAASGFVLSQLQIRSGPILWIQDRLARQEMGGLYVHGLRYEFGITNSIILVDVTRTQDALWAMEEGLRSSGLAGVVGEIWGDAKALDFTATKRLTLRAEQNAVPAFLLRYGASAHLSAARERWCITQTPSLGDLYNKDAPGHPSWHLNLFRSRSTKPAEWESIHDRTTHRLHLSASLRDGALADTSDQAATG